MTTYKNIKGFEIQYLDSDPATSNIGQVWYNSTTKALKGTTAGGATAATWASGGALNTARERLAGTGTQTAALAFGGYNGSNQGVTETYNGSSWSEVADLNTVRYGLGSATAAPQTAALAIGGDLGAPTYTYRNDTEKWDGTSWTEVNNLPTAIAYMAGAGTQTAALSIGGEPTYDASVEFDGTNWTSGGTLNTGRYQFAGCGLQTAAIGFGGRDPTTGKTEIYNGTSWTEVADLNTARMNLGGAGIQTSALAFGGFTPGALAVTEFWNGTSWTEVADLATARYQLAGAGTTSLALAFGGNITPHTAATEEFTAPDTVTVSFTVS